MRTVMREVNPRMPIAYLGDDNTDEPAFQAVNGRGWSVLVRPRWRSTSAQLWIKPPHEVLDLLERWLQACQERDESSNDAAIAVNA